jgi:hypothetical protein
MGFFAMVPVVHLLPNDMDQWRVHIILRRAEHLCTVAAISQRDAIEKAAKLFDISSERPNQINVEKMSKRIT